MIEFFAFVSALLWVGFDFTRKQLTKTWDPYALAIPLVLGQGILFSLFVFIEGFRLTSSLYIWPFLISLVMNCFSNLGLLKAFQKMDISVAIPMLSLTPLISSIASYFLHDGQINFIQGLGMLFLVMGAIVMNLKLFLKKDLDLVHQAEGMIWMIITVICFALIPVFDKEALKYSNASSHGMLVGISVALLTFLYMVFSRKDFKGAFAFRNQGWVLLFAIVFFSAAILVQLYVIQHMHEGIMETIKRCAGVLASLALGKILFKEILNKEKWIASIFFLTGILLVLN